MMDLVTHDMKVIRDVVFFEAKFPFSLVSNDQVASSIVMPQCPILPVPDTRLDSTSGIPLADPVLAVLDPPDDSADSNEKLGEPGVILGRSERISQSGVKPPRSVAIYAIM